MSPKTHSFKLPALRRIHKTFIEILLLQDERGLTLRDLRPTLGFTKHLLYTQDLKNNNFSFHKSKNEEYLIFRLNDE